MTAKDQISEIEGVLANFHEVIKDFDEMVRISKRYHAFLEKSFVVNALQQLFNAEHRLREIASNHSIENVEKFIDGTLAGSIKDFMALTTKGTSGEFAQLEWQLCELRRIGLKLARIAKGIDQAEPSSPPKAALKSRRSKLLAPQATPKINETLAQTRSSDSLTTLKFNEPQSPSRSSESLIIPKFSEPQALPRPSGGDLPNIPEQRPTNTSSPQKIPSLTNISSPNNHETHSPKYNPIVRSPRERAPSLKTAPKPEDPAPRTRAGRATSGINLNKPSAVPLSSVSPRKVEFSKSPSDNKFPNVIPEKSDIPKLDGWFCEDCKFRNNYSTVQCLACHRKRAVPPDSWPCLSCRTYNLITMKKCNMCGRDAPPLPMVYENWVCQVCQVTHNGTLEKCTFCGVLRDGTRGKSFVQRRINRKSDPGNNTKQLIVPFSQTLSL